MRKARGIATHERLAILALLFLLWVGGLGARLVHLQVYDHEWYEERALRQHERVVEVSPTRGRVLDRQGRELARSIEAKSVYATVADVEDPAGVARRLAPVLGVSEKTLLDRLTSDRVFVCLKRKVDARVADAVSAMNIAGLELVGESKRVYPKGQLAAHVLGFCGVDENGLSGVELTYDGEVRGHPGRVVLANDARHRIYDAAEIAPTPGNDLQLTIDEVAQYRVEQALKEGVKQTGANWGIAVVMRPQTGEIVALANYPTFDPNDLSASPAAARRNRAVEATFEPGSVFKIVPFAGCVEERLITPDTRIDCQNGTITIADRVVHDHPYGILKASDALALSSNVAAIKMGMKLGNERFYDYIRRFGFGQRTGIELPGEAVGLLSPVGKWSKTTIGSIPMGHEVAVTAVQEVAAMSVIANGGVWVQPHVVHRVLSPSGQVVSETRPQRRQVISPESAATMNQMLESVVVKGTARGANLGGLRAAGKTGTAQKIDPRTGRYTHAKYVASFCGYAPADAPEFACVVVLDEPGGGRTGGATSAPIFGRILEALFADYAIPPRPSAPDEIAAARAAAPAPIPVTVAPVEPAVPAPAPPDGRPELDVVEATPKNDGAVVVPDLRGRGLRAAMQIGTSCGLNVQASGSGRVARQSPRPGAVVPPGTKLVMELR
jgi:cell division protein FtsI/penicillin-binding protein 2